MMRAAEQAGMRPVQEVDVVVKELKLLVKLIYTILPILKVAFLSN